MKFRFLSLRWKLLTGFTGLVLFLVVSLLFSLSRLVDHRIREDIDQNFVEAGITFENIQEIRFRQLRQTAILLADIPSLKAAISTRDTTTVNQKIREELRYLLDFDPLIPDSLIRETFISDPDSAGLLMVSDNKGEPLGRLATGGLPAFSVADRPGVRNALAGQMALQSYIWKERNRYFNVITIPIWSGFDLLGILSYGLPIRQLEADQLSADLGMEVLFYVDDTIIADSFEGLSGDDRKQLSNNIHDTTFEILQSREAASSEITLDNESWLIYLAPMYQGDARLEGIKGYYGVAKSLDRALIPLQNLQLLIFGIGVLAILASAGISIWLTRRITHPIDLLVEGVHRVENEDFSREVPVTTHDEIGKLTTAFNRLVENLRERLLMLKFVSQATLDAIQKNLNRIEPGGERRDVTVLFSDIRGFTAWSENHTPEEVIEMLNTLLSFQAELVQQLGGDVDKFVGDELIAVFQGPKKDQHAVQAAALIQQKLPAMIETGQSELGVGIGINSGDVIMGAMGSETRMDYTVLGSAVNLGSRLCSAAAKHQILISRTVYLNLERKIPARQLDDISVKGFENPVIIYEVNWQELLSLITTNGEIPS